MKTQLDILLDILKANANEGITAGEIQAIHWIPQYNRAIKNLRDKGHVINSVRVTDQRTRKKLWRFFYVGFRTLKTKSAAPAGQGPRFTFGEL